MSKSSGLLTISLVTAAFVLGFAAGRVAERAGEKVSLEEYASCVDDLVGFHVRLETCRVALDRCQGPPTAVRLVQ